MTKWTVLKPSRWLWPHLVAAQSPDHRRHVPRPPYRPRQPRRRHRSACGRIPPAGSVIAEFPTTLAAAQASRQHGMHVLMGAPNIVRGGSHSGNVAAHQLASHGLLDILSSDYYPASLLDAAFRIADAEDNAFTLPQAIRLVSQHPAQALGLDDRGVIAEGKRADLVLAHRRGEHIQIDHVWRQGKRVF